MVDDPTAKIGGFGLERREQSLLNRLRTGFGCCKEWLFKWNFTDSPLCDCGDYVQSMHHLIHTCHLRRFVGDLKELSDAKSDRDLQWLCCFDLHL